VTCLIKGLCFLWRLTTTTTTTTTTINMPILTNTKNDHDDINFDVMLLVYTRGVDTFSKTLTKLASSSVILLTKSENNWPNI
jgi:hypothetical protein